LLFICYLFVVCFVFVAAGVSTADTDTTHLILPVLVLKWVVVVSSVSVNTISVYGCRYVLYISYIPAVFFIYGFW
jgi:hypothetical protein